MRILLTGASGQLGSDCRVALENDYEIIAPDSEEFSITSWDKVSYLPISFLIVLPLPKWMSAKQKKSFPKESMWKALGTWRRERQDTIRSLFTYLPTSYLMAGRDCHSPILKMIPWPHSLFMGKQKWKAKWL